MKSAAGPQRGEIYWIDFSPATGHEMSGSHPCLIVQNDVGNQHSPLTIVVAITGNLRVASLPVGVLIPAGTGGVNKDCVAHCGHLYTVDQQRLGKKIGVLPNDIMDQVDAAIAHSVDLP